MQALQRFFEKVGFSATDCAEIIQHFKLRNFDTGEYFIQEGQSCKYLGFIESGVFQHFVIDDKGEERSTYVAVEHNFLTSLLSFLHDEPSREYIRCIAKARVWQIEKAHWQALQTKIPDFTAFYISTLEYLIACIERSRFDFITLNAEQRYARMLREEPELLQRIPLQYLAALLGVTPRHLSRIRKRVLL